MSFLKGMVENCLDAMSEEEAEELFRKIVGRVKPEVHLEILVGAFEKLSEKKKEKVRETLFGKKEYAEMKEFIDGWQELSREYEKMKKEGKGLIGPL